MNGFNLNHYTLHSHLQAWPLGKIWRIGSGVYPEFTLSHMHNAAEGFLHPQQHYPGERWISWVQQRETGSDVLTLPRRSCDFVSSTPTTLSALITTNSLDIVFSSLRLLHVIDPPALTRGSSSVDPLLCSHIHFSWICTDFIPGGQADKVCRNCGAPHLDICVHTGTSSGENTQELRSQVHVWKQH